ncbi:MAG TPA: YdeI/OmpD-associated family protein [Thermomicrobiales bacterium]|nr:YdeI/OmpD-associated family protein [Thermomicrobiales bacterium]
MERPARFFDSAAEFRLWLEEHHASESELWVGYYKKGSGRTGLTYSDAVEQALCFGWIDGLTQRIDDASYRQRFTPRRPRSKWSAVNINKVEQLGAAGMMRPAGFAAFDARTPERSGVYAYEQRNTAVLSPEFEERFRANGAAWSWFQSQPPWYQRTATWIVTSAKRESTRERRLEALILASEKGERLERLSPPSGSGH